MVLPLLKRFYPAPSAFRRHLGHFRRCRFLLYRMGIAGSLSTRMDPIRIRRGLIRRTAGRKHPCGIHPAEQGGDCPIAPSGFEDSRPPWEVLGLAWLAALSRLLDVGAGFLHAVCLILLPRQKPRETVPFDDSAAAIHAVIRTARERKGTTVGPHDLMIAAAVLTRNAILETHNTQEFCMISGLRDEDLTLPDMSADTLSGV
jgi:hypothetical protein